MVNLMLVEDNNIVRQALVKYLNEEKDITVVAAAHDGLTAIELLQADPTINVVIADWNMPNMNGLELTNHITAEFKEVKTIILTMHGKQDYIDKAKAAGAKGFILKDGDFDDLVAAIKNVAEGKMVFKGPK
jgi:DNA-binding NarL/FixJ family response regulator